MKLRRKAPWFVSAPEGHPDGYGEPVVAQALRGKYKPLTKRYFGCPSCKTTFIGKLPGARCGACDVELVEVEAPF